MSSSRHISDNRKARFNYEISDKFEAGIVLTGTEVKALRQGRLNMGESYAYIRRDELFWANANIPHYSHGNVNNHDPVRVRKLLVHRQEIRRLIGVTKEKGMSLIPLKAYWKGGKVKLEVGIAKGKKLYDKRKTQQERDWKRDKERLLKAGD
ncbi:MAG: SsrA-binding protein SmpB [Magnetococcales bacterium]|nr:SsrA-binding protein SmpB [Magnetococcales bacterium]